MITGAHLGRDHSIDEVLAYFVRDRLMAFILNDDELDMPRADQINILCSDLTEGQRLQYRSLVEEDEERTRRPNYTPERHEKAKRILAMSKAQGDKSIRGYDQAMQVVLMNEAFNSIDGSIDYKTPNIAVPPILRTFPGVPKPIARSVVTPHSMATSMETEFDSRLNTVDRNCDQVRAMIKTFCTTGEWSLEEFREALGTTMTRDKLTTFLRKRGDDLHQQKSAACLMSWEFFNRRQKMGLEVADVMVRQDI